VAFPALWNKDVNQSHCDKGFRRRTAGVLLQRIWLGDEPDVLKVPAPFGWCVFWGGLDKKKIDIRERYNIGNIKMSKYVNIEYRSKYCMYSIISAFFSNKYRASCVDARMCCFV